MNIADSDNSSPLYGSAWQRPRRWDHSQPIRPWYRTHRLAKVDEYWKRPAAEHYEFKQFKMPIVKGGGGEDIAEDLIGMVRRALAFIEMRSHFIIELDPKWDDCNFLIDELGDYDPSRDPTTRLVPEPPGYVLARIAQGHDVKAEHYVTPYCRLAIFVERGSSIIGASIVLIRSYLIFLREMDLRLPPGGRHLDHLFDARRELIHASRFESNYEIGSYPSRLRSTEWLGEIFKPLLRSEIQSLNDEHGGASENFELLRLFRDMAYLFAGIGAALLDPRQVAGLNKGQVREVAPDSADMGAMTADWLTQSVHAEAMESLIARIILHLSQPSPFGSPKKLSGLEMWPFNHWGIVREREWLGPYFFLWGIFDARLSEGPRVDLMRNLHELRGLGQDLLEARTIELAMNFEIRGS